MNDKPVDITPKQKKVAQRPRHDQQAMAQPAREAMREERREAMFEGNPFAGLFNW